MLYKVILVDDEIWTIRGLLKMIPWEECGFEVVFHTTDSEQAKEYMELLKPDAVISDIQMAFMTGLDLLEYAACMKERPEFVLISAYEEFEYAHKALKLNAFDYLIKPLKKADMVNTLEKLRFMLDKKKKDSLREIEHQILEEYTEISVEEIFRESNIQTVGDRYRIYCCAKGYYDAYMARVCFKSSLNEEILLIEDRQFLYCIHNIPQVHSRDVPEKLKETMYQNMFFMGASIIFDGKQIVYPYIQQARCAALQFLIEIPECIHCYQEERRLLKSASIYRMLQEALSAEKVEVVLHIVQGLDEFVRKNHYTIRDLIGVGNYLCIQLDVKQEDMFQKHGIESVEKFLEKYRNIEDYVFDLTNAVKLAYPEMEKGVVSADDIRRYIDQHYTEKILIGDIADYFHINVNHLGRIFKKKTGVSPKDYLTEKRLERAKHLLSHTDMKIYEISKEIGYTDYFFFTRVFRKMTGVTPSMWREKENEVSGI